MRLIRTTLLAVLLFSVAGCATGQGGDTTRGSGEPAPPEGPSPSASASSPVTPPSEPESPSSTDPPTLTPPSGPPTTPTDIYQPIGLAGTVTVESGGCRILVTDVDVRYVLKGSLAEDLRPGNAVKIVGRATGGYDDLCAGIPFRVTEVLGRSLS